HQATLTPHHHTNLATIQRHTGHNELFDTSVVFQNSPWDEDALGAEGLRVELTDDESEGFTHFPLSIDAFPGDGLRVEISYRPDVFDAAQAEQFVARVEALLTVMATDPGRLVGRTDVLPGQEISHLLALGSGPTEPVPELTVPELFERQAAAHPDVTALVFGDQRLTFRELSVRANRVAHRLIGLGAGSDDPVAVPVPRSVEAIVAALGVMKAGCTYLPVEPSWPPERIAALFADVRPFAALTVADTLALVPGDYTSPVLRLDEPDADVPSHDPGDTDRVRPLLPTHLAYVIHTSGSTGRPKGVAVTHRNLVNLHHAQNSAYMLPAVASLGGRRLAVALVAPLGFDAAWADLLRMVAGHELHLIDDAVRQDPERLVGYCTTHRIDCLNLTPLYAAHLVSAGLLRSPGHLPRLISLGGETVDESLWAELGAAGVFAYNLYGASECAVDSTCTRVSGGIRSRIGRPMDNTQVYVLDNALR
ncbi:AMP-binding protein, partial [Streptomyces sp. KLOTTS4A1]|uniref:AMP-binding protein n=1 Tax=Streptomyces sp. KLOTTS4A1 TaxID=3390996 RepID=UPI0039F5E428